MSLKRGQLILGILSVNSRVVKRELRQLILGIEMSLKRAVDFGYLVSQFKSG
jgi:hypothetical protein